MKSFTIFLTLFAIVALCQVEARNDPAITGEPGCLTEDEIAVGVYPHFRIKRAYWQCSVLGQPATLELCPIAQGFLAPAQACVPWAEWYWSPTVAPPSSPVTVAPEGSGQ